MVHCEKLKQIFSVSLVKFIFPVSTIRYYNRNYCAFVEKENAIVHSKYRIRVSFCYGAGFKVTYAKAQNFSVSLEQWLAA